MVSSVVHSIRFLTVPSIVLNFYAAQFEVVSRLEPTNHHLATYRSPAIRRA
jgi:hypothetical protein